MAANPVMEALVAVTPPCPESCEAERRRRGVRVGYDAMNDTTWLPCDADEGEVKALHCDRCDRLCVCERCRCAGMHRTADGEAAF